MAHQLSFLPWAAGTHVNAFPTQLCWLWAPNTPSTLASPSCVCLFLNILCVMCIPAWIYVHYVGTGAFRGQKMSTEVLELETWVFCQREQPALLATEPWLQTHLTFPLFALLDFYRPMTIQKLGIFQHLLSILTSHCTLSCRKSYLYDTDSGMLWHVKHGNLIPS